MALNIRGKIYYGPNEGDQPGVLGRELIEIDDHFGLDALTLLSIFDDPKVSTIPGYSRSKAMFALAWICLTRGGEILSIHDVLNDYSIDDFVEAEDEEVKKELTVSSEAEPAQE